ncbi:MAG TPA: ABC transporter ATP-binding protein [Planctomycetaceae bacterium]|jgi:ABC-type polysaccharide/polyol phosphate transport system ATPase subunit
MTTIDLEDVSLVFRVRQQRRVALKDFIVKQMFRRSVNPYMEVRALANVNLTVREGDRLGIVGHNGAGKSTMLKMLAGIYPPTSGSRRVVGEISSLFDLQLGFEPEASGWENIAYRGYLQGETPRTLKGKLEQIAEFSELAEFLHSPVRHYSSGMLVRLAFSVASAIDPEILLVDEVLSAADMGFQKKCRQRMEEMIAKARLIVMVNHDLDVISRFCNRAIWLDHGNIRLAGTTDEVIAAYTEAMGGGALHIAPESRPQHPIAA